jgi:tetratricopeptide (TPR) repeat protein
MTTTDEALAVPDDPSPTGASPDRPGPDPDDGRRSPPRPSARRPGGGAKSPRRGSAGQGRPRGPQSTERSSIPPGLDVPKGASAPVGLERARRREGAPPRTARPKVAPPRPDLPTDEEPQLPRAIRKEIDRVIGSNARGRDVALALSIGSAAIDEGYLDVATEMLTWAKDEAPRIAAVREAYGVALYLTEDFAGALSELQAYRRLTGKVDQNHLVADCLRALGRELDRVVDAAQELVADPSAPADRRAEAAIVWAGALADAGDLGAGRAVIRRVLRDAGDAEHDLRARYVAADLAARDGDTDEARAQFELISSADPDYLDVAERLASLPG